MEKSVIDQLIAKAKQFTEYAYCPYSGIPIGACVLTKNGMLFGGCNIENSCLSGSLGAIEVAVSKAVSEGCFHVLAVAVFSQNIMPFPTGSERQMLLEFNNKPTVIIANGSGEVVKLNTQEILPFAREKIDNGE
ncbi:MAG: cytidine deaminase [Clostridia bacterium]|nr:cytidine deaminase [Clostridia bacterium]